MPVTIAVARAAAQVAGGNQDITTADLGGLTPKAAFLTVTYATSDGVAANNAMFCIGAADDSGNEWAVAVSCEHGQLTMDTYRGAWVDECVVILNPATGAIDGEADYNAMIADGIRITWGNNPAAGYLITAVFYAGTDTSAHAGVFAIGNQNVETNVNTVGFEPDVILTGTHHRATFDGAVAAFASISHGVVVNDGSDTQASYTWQSDDGVGTSNVHGEITGTYGVMQRAAFWKGDFGTFDAQGFSCTPRLANANVEVGYLALAFNGEADFWAGIIDTPIAAGNQSLAAPGFEPQHVHVGLTQLLALDTTYTTGDAGSIGVSVFDEDDAFCNSIQDEDGQGTSDNQSLSDDQVINFPADDGGVAFVATFTSFDANGWTWNFTQTLGAIRRWWALAIETSVLVGPAPETIVGRNLMYVEQVTYREPYGLQLVGGDDERLEVFLAQRGLPSL